MKITIDCRYIRERPSGIGAYVRALVDRLPALAPDLDFVLWRHPLAPAPLNAASNVTEVRAPSNPNEPFSLLFPRLFAWDTNVTLRVIDEMVQDGTLHQIRVLKAPGLTSRAKPAPEGEVWVTMDDRR